MIHGAESPQTTSNTVRMWSFFRPTIVEDTKKYKSNTFGFYAGKGNSVIDFRNIQGRRT
ncbi:MAG: hypothetical protein ACP5T1_07310 [Thermoplasmata archaeon]